MVQLLAHGVVACERFMKRPGMWRSSCASSSLQSQRRERPPWRRRHHFAAAEAAGLRTRSGGKSSMCGRTAQPPEQPTGLASTLRSQSLAATAAVCMRRAHAKARHRRGRSPTAPISAKSLGSDFTQTPPKCTVTSTTIQGLENHGHCGGVEPNAPSAAAINLDQSGAVAAISERRHR
jgi:hypothetical protein